MSLVAQFCITQAPQLSGERASVSASGSHWTERFTALDGSAQIHNIAFGAGLWVYGTFASGSDTEVIQTSPDGNVWTPRSSPADTGELFVVIWVQDLSLFVAMASVSGTEIAMTSPDGITWTSHTLPGTAVFIDVAWSPTLGLLAAVGGSGSDNIATSPDGASWTLQTSPGANDFIAIEWGAGKFVVLNATIAVGPPQLVTSTDGVTWTVQSPINNSYTFFDLVFADNRFVAVGAAVSPTDVNRVATSADGLTWTTHVVTPRTWHGVTWGNGVYVACADDNPADGSKAVMISHDGAVWHPTGSDLYPINCVAVGFNGGRAIGNQFDGPSQGAGNQFF